jgi:hypothetical protein
MIKADLKHWGGRKAPYSSYKINYPRFAEQAYQKLGKGGVVGVPNARGSGNRLGAEFRFEELFAFASKSRITPLGDGRVFHDDNYDIWFVKAQEINQGVIAQRPITYLVFNLPMKVNLRENESIPFFYDPHEHIKILTAPSCIDTLKYMDEHENYINGILHHFDGFIVHASTATINPGLNEFSQEFYDKYVRGKIFKDPFGREHPIGAITVSGGHRSPKQGFIQKIFSPISIGSSYTLFPEFKGETLDDFNNWLRHSIETSEEPQLVRGTAKRETLFRHLPRMLEAKLY